MQRNPWLKLVIYMLHGLQWSFVAMPLFCWLSVFVLAYNVRQILGHWPRENVDPIPSAPELWISYRFASLLMHYGEMLYIPAVLFLALILKWLDPETKQRYPLLAIPLGIILLLVLMFIDPTRSMLWYLD